MSAEADAATQLGLTSKEAARRLARSGPNVVVPEIRRTGVWALARRIVTDPMTVLLLVAGPTYVALRDYVSAAVVLAALVPVTAITVVLEARAERALAELNRRAALTARVWRDGQLVTLAAAELVPGDRLRFAKAMSPPPTDASSRDSSSRWTRLRSRASRSLSRRIPSTRPTCSRGRMWCRGPGRTR
jgi:Ca2+-transporting ATPase